VLQQVVSMPLEPLFALLWDNNADFFNRFHALRKDTSTPLLLSCPTPRLLADAAYGVGVCRGGGGGGAPRVSPARAAGGGGPGAAPGAGAPDVSATLWTSLAAEGVRDVNYIIPVKIPMSTHEPAPPSRPIARILTNKKRDTSTSPCAACCPALASAVVTATHGLAALTVRLGPDVGSKTSTPCIETQRIARREPRCVVRMPRGSPSWAKRGLRQTRTQRGDRGDDDQDARGPLWRHVRQSVPLHPDRGRAHRDPCHRHRLCQVS
jgi:hypothetical protein